MTETVLELIGTRMSFSGKQLFDVQRLTFRSETCLVLTGANGSGKTTLLKIAAGLLAPDRGTISFDGRDFSWQRAYRSLRRRVVYLHQFPYMFDASVFDNVAYGLRRKGVPAPEARAQVRQALEWAGLSGHTSQNARSLSGGEKQRVALARARVLSPHLLLLDEPIANMDEEGRERTLFFIRQMVSDGFTVALATHERQLVQQVAQLHLRLEGGRLIEKAVPARTRLKQTRVKKARSA